MEAGIDEIWRTLDHVLLEKSRQADRTAVQSPNAKSALRRDACYRTRQVTRMRCIILIGFNSCPFSSQGCVVAGGGVVPVCSGGGAGAFSSFRRRASECSDRGTVSRAHGVFRLVHKSGRIQGASPRGAQSSPQKHAVQIETETCV